MANTMSIREALAVFERFSQHIQLVSGNLCLSSSQNGVRVEGCIEYPYKFIETDSHYGSIWVNLSVDGKCVFSQTFETRYPKPAAGWLPPIIGVVCDALKSKYKHSPDTPRVLDFIRRMDKPLRDEQARQVQERQEKDQREKDNATEKLRKIMR